MSTRGLRAAVVVSLLAHLAALLTLVKCPAILLDAKVASPSRITFTVKTSKLVANPTAMAAVVKPHVTKSLGSSHGKAAIVTPKLKVGPSYGSLLPQASDLASRGNEAAAPGTLDSDALPVEVRNRDLGRVTLFAVISPSI